jgi:hypothetical protein
MLPSFYESGAYGIRIRQSQPRYQLRLAEIAFVLVRLDHVTRLIVSSHMRPHPTCYSGIWISFLVWTKWRVRVEVLWQRLRVRSILEGGCLAMIWRTADND